VAGGGFSKIGSFGCDVLIDKNGILGIQLNFVVGVGLLPLEVHGAYCLTALIPQKGLYSLVWVEQNLRKIVSVLSGALS